MFISDRIERVVAKIRILNSRKPLIVLFPSINCVMTQYYFSVLTADLY